MMPFGALIRILDGKRRHIEVSEIRLTEILTFVASRVIVNSEWYLEFYRDVRETSWCGASSCTEDHYTEYGYFEDRMPRAVEVDAKWYLNIRTFLIRSVRFLGESPQHHFERGGFKERRRAHRDWVL